MKLNPNWTKWNVNFVAEFGHEPDYEDNPHEKYLNARLVRPVQTDQDVEFDRDYDAEQGIGK